ncbi:fibronectin type III domain-containing protein [Candidatus Peregrinibacteria bacterium]|jgi:hypothetical protein|nr:fibronectin type III domain-containing protein [Candidatus Peregrinibacteria bacterium]
MIDITLSKIRSLKKVHIHISILAILLTTVGGFLLSNDRSYAGITQVDCSGDMGSPTAVDEASLTGEAVTFANTGGDGVCSLSAAITNAASVTINADVVVVHDSESSVGFNISTTGNFALNGEINVEGRGCASTTGPDASNACTNQATTDGDQTAPGGEGADDGSGFGGGAGYGGEGGRTPTDNGGRYGSSIYPSFLGSGGGNATGGGGGGMVKLDIGGDAAIDGTLTANGKNGGGAHSGGGSGGSILVNVDGALTGSGSISANGGDRAGTSSGSGGGGRIALYYGPSSSIGTLKANTTVDAGTLGAAGEDGTILIVSDPDADTDVTDGYNSAETSDDTWLFSGDHFDILDEDDGSDDSTVTLDVASLTIETTSDSLIASDVTTINLTADTLDISENGTIDCGDTATAQWNWLSIDSITWANQDLTCPEIDWGTATDLSFSGSAAIEASKSEDVDAMTINANGTTAGLILTDTASWSGNMLLENLTTLNVGGTASITADTYGCDQEEGPSVSNVCQVAGDSLGGEGVDPDYAGGGGYGGDGGESPSGGVDQGASFGSALHPIHFGAGGGDAANGGAGGGRLKISTTGNAVVDGTISANGQTAPGGNGGGGSGGAVYLRIGGSLSGSGDLNVNGGNASSSNNGDGGGGRIAIYYVSGTPTTLISNATANEGTVGQNGENGTILFAIDPNNDSDGASGFLSTETDDDTWRFIGNRFNLYDLDDGSDDSTVALTVSSLDIDTTGTSDVQSDVTTVNWTVGTLNASGDGIINCVDTSTVQFNWLSIDSFTWADHDMTCRAIDFGVDTDMTFSGSATITTVDELATGITVNNNSADNKRGLTLSGTASFVGNILLENLTTLNIGGTSSLTANAMGCGEFTGATASNTCEDGGDSLGGEGDFSGWAGAGGHGGAGGHAAGGGTYGSQTAPVLMGSGGGAQVAQGGENGGDGGGRIILQTSGNAVINGAVSVDGENGGPATGGGGSGGSLYLVTIGELSGTGSLDAKGGNSSGGSNGSGGGGRMAIYYGTLGGGESVSSSGDVAAGTGGTVGGVGTLEKAALSAPDAPTISSPANSATGVSRTPTVTSSAFSGDISHTYTDWEIAEDSDFTKIIWSYTGEATSNLESIVVNSSNGTFAGRHAGQTQLQAGTYYIRARHANAVGESSDGASNSFTVLNTAPTVASLSASQHTDGTGVVDLEFIIDDANDDNLVEAKVEVYNGSSWTAATLSTDGGDTSATYGTPTVDNGETYQVGNAPTSYISTSSGANTINVDWDVASDFADLDTSSAQFRVTPYDQGGEGTVQTSTTFTVDLVAPTTPGSLSKDSGSGTTAVMTWTASTETNFANYSIWYGTSQSDVQNLISSEWSDSNDGDLATISTTTTTVTGLTAGNTYYALICGVDDYGNEGCGSDISFVTNQVPTVTSVSGSPSTDGSGEVRVTVAGVDDPDDDDTLQLKVEYNTGAGWTKATITEGAISATYGNPNIENDNAYQVGNASGYITTSSGANQLIFKWESMTDEPTADLSTAKLRVIPYDGVADGSEAESSSLTLDNVAPSGMASFAASATTSSTITWGWTAASSETSFDHYEIWYGENQSDVENRTGTATEWDDSDDSNFTTMSTSSTTITGLNENKTYYAKIWAIDSYTNEATLSAATANNNGLPTLSNATATQATDGSGEVTVQFSIDDADDDDTLQVQGQYNIGSGWVPIDFSETAEDISVSAGTESVSVENDNTYQIGNASGYIKSSSGINTVRIVWPTLSQVGGDVFDTSSAQVRLTPYDATENGAILSISSVTLDNVDPTTIAGVLVSRSGDDLAVSWTAPTESNFDHYEIWYGTTAADVENRTGTATEYDNDDDSNLATLATTSTSISGLDLSSPGETYYASIFAVDDYGNETTTTSSFFTGVVGTSSSVSRSSSDTEDAAEEAEGTTEVSEEASESSTEDTEATEAAEAGVERTGTTGAEAPGISETTDGISTVETTDQTDPEEGSSETSAMGNLIKNTQQIVEEKEYTTEAKGRLERLIDSKTSEASPWSARHFKALLKNESVSEYINTSGPLAVFIQKTAEKPNKTITQEDALKILIATTTSEKKVMQDFNNQALKAAEDRGLVSQSDALDSEATLTRAQALILLFKTASPEFRSTFMDTILEEFGPGALPFEDVNITDRTAPYIYFFYNKGFIEGYENGRYDNGKLFKPDAEMTNAEFVKTLNLVQQEMKRLEEESPETLSFKDRFTALLNFRKGIGPSNSKDRKIALFNSSGIEKLSTQEERERRVQKFIRMFSR